MEDLVASDFRDLSMKVRRMVATTMMVAKCRHCDEAGDGCRLPIWFIDQRCGKTKCYRGRPTVVAFLIYCHTGTEHYIEQRTQAHTGTEHYTEQHTQALQKTTHNKHKNSS